MTVELFEVKDLNLQFSFNLRLANTLKTTNPITVTVPVPIFFREVFCNHKAQALCL